MLCTKREVWFKNPSCLFKNIFPKQGMNQDEEVNLITLYSLIFIICLYFFDFIQFRNMIFLILFVLLIIIFSVILKKEMSKTKVTEQKLTENFTWSALPNNAEAPSYKRTTAILSQEIKDNSGYDTYSKLVGTINMNQSDNTPNNEFANGDGNYNPNIFIKPIITPPITDLGHWRTNNFVNHSSINYRARTDLSQSGYITQKTDNRSTYPRISENYEQRKSTSTLKEAKREEEENTFLTTTIDGGSSGEKSSVSDTVINIRTTPITGSYSGQGYTVIDKPSFNTVINESYGYYPNNPKLKGAPVNIPTEESMEFNKKIFTTSIGPKITMFSDVVQPVNSNLGITYSQQFQPRTFEVQNDDEILVKRHDPYQYTHPQQEEVAKQRYDNVYDPTSAGYGTSYRRYIEPIVNQPRYYYDDINNVRKPNMITRNEIDHTNWAEKYGLTYGTATQQGVGLEEVKELAHEAFNQAELSRRVDISSSLMRKRMDVDWQRKLYPINRNSSKAVH